MDQAMDQRTEGAPRPKLDAGDETGMNMTPMIDIVFQLIIFFMLSLRFRTVDERIDTQLPKDRSCGGTVFPEEVLRVKLKLVRRHKGEAHAYTLLKIDGSHQFALPAGEWPRGAEGRDFRVEGYDRVRRQVLAVLSAKWAAVGGDPDMQAEIVAAPPHGGSVPHGDAMFALDVLMEAGLTDVVFEGAAPPLHGP